MIQPNLNQNRNFNQPGLEQVRVLYKNKKEDYTKSHIEVKNDKEIIKDVINDIFDKEINKRQIADINVKVKSFTVFSGDDDDDEKRTNTTLEELVKIAFDKNVAASITLSCKTSNAYLIDRLHDILIDKFYDELIKQDKIKK
jgi:hypothetical protein